MKQYVTEVLSVAKDVRAHGCGVFENEIHDMMRDIVAEKGESALEDSFTVESPLAMRFAAFEMYKGFFDHCIETIHNSHHFSVGDVRDMVSITGAHTYDQLLTNIISMKARLPYESVTISGDVYPEDDRRIRLFMVARMLRGSDLCLIHLWFVDPDCCEHWHFLPYGAIVSFSGSIFDVRVPDGEHRLDSDMDEKVFHWVRGIQEQVNPGEEQPAIIPYVWDPASFQQCEEDFKNRMIAHVEDLFINFIYLLNTKNITSEVVSPNPKLQKKRLKKKKVPYYEYRVLKVSSNRIGTGELNSAAPGETKRLHSCMGHLKYFSPDKPLFGKFSGSWWWNDHLRGKSSKGVIDKDYECDFGEGASE